MNRFALLLVVLWAATPMAWSVGMNSCSDLEEQIISLSNDVRAGQGLPLLRLSPTLRQAALNHSQDMHENNYFGHHNPYMVGDNVLRRAQKAGSANLICAENLFKCRGYSSKEAAQKAISAWLNSSAHRKILLNPRYNRIGVGVICEGGTYYFTQDVATEAVEILDYKVTDRGGEHWLHLKAHVVEGPQMGALLIGGRRFANWAANAEGDFELSVQLPTLAAVEIGQETAPLSWKIETQLCLQMNSNN